VYAYRDYRAYLRAFYAHKKARGRGFSLRVFSRAVDSGSSNILKLVMDGDRNLSPAMAQRFAGACGLEGAAAGHFCDLVAFNQAKTTGERDRAYQRLKASRRYREIHQLDAAQDAYHGRWYIPAIRELAAHRDFRPDPRWIARTLVPSITPRQAREALKVLREIGLLVEGEDGTLSQAQPLLSTPDRPLGHHVVRYHRAMMERAAEALDDIPRDEREMGSLTLCLSEQSMHELKAHLQRFREELLQSYVADDDATRVVQVNFQMFPLSAPSSAKEK
jgi:uncharacterized protein (TIGR02147 family)